MTPRERAAYAAGIEAARQAALAAAVTIETRDDANEARQQAAAAALQGLAEGLRCIQVDLYNGSEAGTGREAGS